MKKKLLLILLTFSMLLPLFSGMTFTALAAGNVAKIERTGTEYASLAAAVAAAQAGDTVTLLADNSYSSTIALNKNITVNGAGKTVTYTGTSSAFSVSSTVALKNMTISAASGGGFNVTSGSLALGERDNAESAVTVFAAGTSDATSPLYVTGSSKTTLNLYYANFTAQRSLIRLNGDQYELNIYGGEYNMTLAESDPRLLQTGTAASSATNPVRNINIYGGEFYSHVGYVFLFQAPGLTVNVYNGYFNHSGTGARYMLIKNGTTTKPTEINIHGGFFDLANINIPFGIDTAGVQFNGYGGTVIYEGFTNANKTDSYHGRQVVHRAGGTLAPNIYGMTVLHAETLSDLDLVYSRIKIRPVLTAGAAVSLDPDVPGIKFTATMPQYAYNNLVSAGATNISYGMLIAPASKHEELHILNFDTVNCLGLEEGKDYENIPASSTGIGPYGDITFTAELTGIDEKYFGLDYSANAYVKYTINGKEAYAFSNFSEANTRNMKDIATRALADHDEYDRGYNAKQIEALENYAGAAYVEDDVTVTRLLCLNVLATNAPDYTFYAGQSQADYTFARRLEYIKEIMEYTDPDVMLLQEWSKANGWASVVTLNGSNGRYTSPQFPGYEWISHMNRRGDSYEDYNGTNWWEMFNFVVYDTSKFDYISSGSRFNTKSGQEFSQSEDLLKNTDSGQVEYDGDLGEFTWVVLQEKVTGLKSIYVSVHPTQGTISNADGNARNAYFLDNMQAITNYMQDVSKANGDAPVIIGGDFNMPTYGGDLMYHYKHFTEASNYRDAKVTGTDSGTVRNLGQTTQPRMGAADNDIKIDYIFANGADTYGYDVLRGQILPDGTYDPYANVGSSSVASEGYDISDHLPLVTDIIIRKGQTYEEYDKTADVYSNPNTADDTVVANASGTGSSATKVYLNNEAARAAVKTITNEHGAQYAKADIVNDAEKGNVLRISMTDETNLVNVALDYSQLYTQSLSGYTKIRVTYKTEFTYSDASVSLRMSQDNDLQSVPGQRTINGSANGEWKTIDISFSSRSDNLKLIGFYGNFMSTGLFNGDAIYIASIELLP